MVMTNGSVITIVSDFWPVCAVGSELSFARTTKLKVPAWVGVPLITPSVDNDNPGGRDPEGVKSAQGCVGGTRTCSQHQVYGGLPPVADNTCGGYCEPTTPPGKELVVIVICA